MGIKITWDGLDALKKAMSKQGVDETKVVLKMALYQEAQLIMSKSLRLVPVDTTALKQSGGIEPPRTRGDHIEVVMGYGGAASAYALRQHEDLSYKHEAGKTAKYLENPARERTNDLPDRLAFRMGKIFGKRNG